MSPPRGAGTGRTKRRGPPSESSELGGAQGRGPMVPRLDPGRDTLLGLPRSTRRTLALATATTIGTGATGGYAETTFPLNDAYNGGTSPAGYAKYMAFYSKCFVVGARATVRAAVIDNATASAAFLGLCVTTNSTSLASHLKMIQNGMTNYQVVFNIPDRIALTQGVNVSRFLNKPKVLDDPQLFSTSAASPTQLVVAHVGTQAIGTSSASIAFGYIVEQEYDCVFTDPIPFA